MILNRSAASKAQEIAGQRAAAISEINRMIGEARLRYITDLPGQETIYGEKEREAIAYLATNPDPEFPGPVDQAQYPFTFRECEGAGYTPWEAAQLFLNMAAQWRPLGARLEGLRIGHIATVSAALTVEEMDAARADLAAILENI